ncbi:FAD/NAD(P)-binding protein [Streptoalloteichus hindustanus]|uniref:NAD(P)H-flavin reductase n=1 Tax=Streptoalloteichus hindustanus TaxID=2017 RepID=A0A1M5DTG4_STRHI|nr:FAD/NAD(P)-binding protein [Streptoalloteichus hindustanus]SHF70184.1 NAD(P)H-flavin reductase [Streptoalloteichus hindustanus]
MTTAAAPTHARRPDPMTPVPHRVIERRRETHDTVTLRLAPTGSALPPFRPGQFTMLLAPGVGEVPISVSGDPTATDGVLEQTIRVVGAVTRALTGTPVGGVVGARGPYGTEWDVPSARGGDLVLVGGGCGLAPLRPALLEALAHRAHYRRVVAVLGARDPENLVFADQMARWRRRADVEVHVTVDRAGPDWPGRVDLVTAPLAETALEPARTVALLCGPEVMIRRCAALLLDRGVPATRVRVSLERNMKCGIGHCGHCQLGPLLLCRDGPVVPYSAAAPQLAVREL